MQTLNQWRTLFAGVYEPRERSALSRMLQPMVEVLPNPVWRYPILNHRFRDIQSLSARSGTFGSSSYFIPHWLQKAASKSNVQFLWYNSDIFFGKYCIDLLKAHPLRFDSVRSESLDQDRRMRSKFTEGKWSPGPQVEKFFHLRKITSRRRQVRYIVAKVSQLFCDGIYDFCRHVENGRKVQSLNKN